MQGLDVRLGIISRMVAWGGASGMMLGALYPSLAVLLIQLLKTLFGSDANEANVNMLSIWAGVGCVAGLLVGGIVGLVLGLFIGVVLAILTYRVFNPTHDVRRYQRAIEITCVVIGGLTALLLVLISGLPQYGATGWGAEWSWVVWGVTPTLLATAAIWWAGRRVAAWVGAATPI